MTQSLVHSAGDVGCPKREVDPLARNRLPCFRLLTILPWHLQSLPTHCTDTLPSSTTDRRHDRSHPPTFRETRNDHLVAEYKMTAEQAYCLCGAAVDLKISEIDDAPKWIVSAYLPLVIFY